MSARKNPSRREPKGSALRHSLRESAHLLWVAAGFSFCLNLLVLAAPIYMLQVYDRVLTSRSVPTLLLLTGITLVAMVAMSWLDALRMQLLARAGARLETSSIATVLSRTLAQSTAGTGTTPYHAGLRDLRVVRQFLAGQGFIALADAPWAPLFVAAIALFHPLLGWMAAGGIAALLGLALIDDRITRQRIAAAGQASAAAGAMADEAIAQSEAVRSMGMGPAVAQRVAQASGEAIEASLIAARTSGRLLAVSKFMRQALQSVMLGTGAYLVMQQEASPGVMIAATLVLGRALAPIEAIVSHGRTLIEARLAWKRLSAFLGDTEATAPMTLPKPKGALEVERVVQAITPGVPILKGLAFRIEAGEMLGVIGPSGAGKSLLGRLMVGNLKPTSGHIRLDGADLEQWSQDELGRHLGYLPQDVQLFDGTVAENIARLGDADLHARSVVQAAELAGVHELILQLPQGYQTRVGPRGSFLSGGQRQLIGLARAVFGVPRLVVLDEPNASLDADGEARLLTLLATLKRRRVTVVFITHRPTLLRSADRILVLHQGQQGAFGSADEVLGRFARAMSAGQGTAPPAPATAPTPAVVPVQPRVASGGVR